MLIIAITSIREEHAADCKAINTVMAIHIVEAHEKVSILRVACVVIVSKTSRRSLTQRSVLTPKIKSGEANPLRSLSPSLSVFFSFSLPLCFKEKRREGRPDDSPETVQTGSIAKTCGRKRNVVQV